MNIKNKLYINEVWVSLFDKEQIIHDANTSDKIFSALVLEIRGSNDEKIESEESDSESNTAFAAEKTPMSFKKTFNFCYKIAAICGSDTFSNYGKTH